MTFTGKVHKNPKDGKHYIVEWDGTTHGDLGYWQNRGARIKSLGNSDEARSEYELVYDDNPYSPGFRQRLKNNRR